MFWGMRRRSYLRHGRLYQGDAIEVEEEDEFEGRH